jgi:hypothetical protein
MVTIAQKGMVMAGCCEEGEMRRQRARPESPSAREDVGAYLLVAWLAVLSLVLSVLLVCCMQVYAEKLK